MGAWDVLMLVVATLDRQQWLDPEFTLDGVIYLEMAWAWDLTDGPASGVDGTVMFMVRGALAELVGDGSRCEVRTPDSLADPEWMGGERWAR